MKKKIALNIHQPCSKKWENMTPTNSNRYCSQCAKKVIDFTMKSDQEILRMVEQNKGSVCGRLNVTQLNRPLAIHEQKKSNTWLSSLFSGLLFLGSSDYSNAQTYPSENQSVTHRASYEKDSEKSVGKTNIQTTTPPTDSLFIEGIIRDENNAKIPFAEIRIKNTNFGVVTDTLGYYKLIIPKSVTSDRIDLIISAVQYQEEPFTIYKSLLPTKKDFFLFFDYLDLMGEVSISYENKGPRKKR